MLSLVATVLTVYGIETQKKTKSVLKKWLQQYLPFTVLKLGPSIPIIVWAVATVLTVYGIETLLQNLQPFPKFCLPVATVLTVYGIETNGVIYQYQ